MVEKGFLQLLKLKFKQFVVHSPEVPFKLVFKIQA